MRIIDIKLELTISPVNFNDIEKEVYSYVEKLYRNVKNPSHGFDHVLRVYRLCLEIGIREKADLNVLKIASLLHDIGRALGYEKNHAAKSAEIAEKYLSSLGLPPEFIERVIEAIKAHSFSSGEIPKSLEAKVLSDADKLDAIGAVGIARCFMYSGEQGRGIDKSIEHFYEKLLRLKDLMYTETAKKIALKRHKVMLKFLEQLKKELELKDVNSSSWRI